MTDFSLKLRERRFLEGFVTCPCGSRELRRAQALLWLGEGAGVEEVAERLRVSRQTVYNWQARFCARCDLEPAARLADGERSGRPRTALGIIDPLIDEVIEQDPREWGYRSTVWTAALLRRTSVRVSSTRGLPTQRLLRALARGRPLEASASSAWPCAPASGDRPKGA